MAEFLIKAISVSNTDPEIDKGCYKIGDIVDIRPDGWSWGNEEGLPRFYIVKVTGLNADNVKELIDSQTDGDIENPKMIKRRLWAVDVATLPQWVSDSLTNTGAVTLTLQQARAIIRNKVTGKTY